MIARWMIVGAVIWVAVMAAFRFATADVLSPEVAGIPWLFIVLPFATFAITFVLLAIMRTPRPDRAEVAGVFALPGLLIGIYTINSFGAVFPNLPADMGPSFACMMYASYAAVILAGIASSRLQQRAATLGN
jgi:hypothetical protein